MVPKSSNEASAAAQKLGRRAKRRLLNWLTELEAGDLDPAEIRLYKSVHRDPPWQRGECSGDLVVIFRAMTEEERAAYVGGGRAPYFYVAFVVPPTEERDALTRLAGEIRAREEQEEKAEQEAFRKPQGKP